MPFAQLQRIDDPRDKLEKSKRWELLAFAREKQVKEITHEMPAILMRKILRSKGLTDIKTKNRVLGQPDHDRGSLTTTPQPENVVSMDASDDLMRQYQSGAMAAPAPTVQPYEQMTRAELAKTCKARGISMARTDKKELLMEKLRGKDAA